MRDMCALKEKAASVLTQFENGFFTVKKSQRKFSAIAIDHAHEQNNTMVKGDGGAVGLTEQKIPVHLEDGWFQDRRFPELSMNSKKV